MRQPARRGKVRNAMSSSSRQRWAEAIKLGTPCSRRKASRARPSDGGSNCVVVVVVVVLVVVVSVAVAVAVANRADGGPAARKGMADRCVSES